MVEMQTALRSLIALGRSRGYLLRAEAFQCLIEGLTHNEQADEVLGMMRDLGIPVVDEPPTDEELATITALLRSPTPSPNPGPVAYGPAGPPTGQPLVVLRVGAEGGDIRLIAQELTTGWRYRYSMLDQASLWLDEGDAEIRRQSAWVNDWRNALESLDRYPWARLQPIEVHPRFADRVLEAARERLTRLDPSFKRRLHDWSMLCNV
jgi:hypothetical protein